MEFSLDNEILWFYCLISRKKQNSFYWKERKGWMQTFPKSEPELEDALTRPNEKDISAASQLSGDVVVLGAGGKIGPSLVVRIKRAIEAAAVPYRVKAVVRRDRNGDFAAYADRVDVIEADLLDGASYDRLPDAPNVVFMAGRKFGSVGDLPLTWATNVWIAGLAASRYRGSRMVAFSTGNVYPFVPAEAAAPTEATPPAPVGEYAQSALGRERIFEHFAKTTATPVLIFRLNYAVDLRYGVLVDIGQKVLHGQPIDLTMGYFNAIWQGDANSYVLRSFALCDVPARHLNVTGPQTLSVRTVARRFGELFGIAPILTGQEAATALLSDASHCMRELGPVEVTEDELIEMTAHWLSAGMPTLGKPTGFERRDGKF